MKNTWQNSFTGWIEIVIRNLNCPCFFFHFPSLFLSSSSPPYPFTPGAFARPCTLLPPGGHTSPRPPAAPRAYRSHILVALSVRKCSKERISRAPALESCVKPPFGTTLARAAPGATEEALSKKPYMCCYHPHTSCEARGIGWRWRNSHVALDGDGEN